MDDYAFEREYSIRCLEANRHNHITATYHLINKKNQRNAYMRETFSTHHKSSKDDNATKRDRLQSQGATVKTTAIETTKPAARKAIQDELNQTIQPTNDKKFIDLD